MPSSICRALRFDGGDHALRRIVQVVDAGRLTAALMCPIVERRNDHVLLFEHEAGDVERRREPQFLAPRDAISDEASVIHPEADQVKRKSDPEHHEGRKRQDHAPEPRRPAPSALHTMTRFHSMAAAPPMKTMAPKTWARCSTESKLALRSLRSLTIRTTRKYPQAQSGQNQDRRDAAQPERAQGGRVERSLTL